MAHRWKQQPPFSSGPMSGPPEAHYPHSFRFTSNSMAHPISLSSFSLIPKPEASKNPHHHPHQNPIIISTRAKAGAFLINPHSKPMADKGVPLPKFGEWDVNDPTSAEGFTVIFNKARTEKKTGGRPESPAKDDSTYKHGAVLGKPPAKKWFCCLRAES